MITFALISTYTGYPEDYGIPTLGIIPSKLPLFQPPNLYLIPKSLKIGLTIAVLVIGLHLSTTKNISKKFDYSIDQKQEIHALGLTSLFSGFFPVYPSSISFATTSIQLESGVKTQLSGLFSSLFLLFFIKFLTQFFKNLPMCIISTVILYTFKPTFMKFKEAKRLYSVCTVDFVSFLSLIDVEVKK